MIYFWPELWYLDPFCTYFFSILVLCTTFPVTSKCFRILTEACPENISTKQLYKDIWALNQSQSNYIKDIHDLHVWSLSVNKLALTVHIKSLKPQFTLKQVTLMLRRKYSIYHATIQCESVEDDEINHLGDFSCENDLHD